MPRYRIFRVEGDGIRAGDYNSRECAWSEGDVIELDGALHRVQSVNPAEDAEAQLFDARLVVVPVRRD